MSVEVKWLLSGIFNKFSGGIYSGVAVFADGSIPKKWAEPKSDSFN